MKTFILALCFTIVTMTSLFFVYGGTKASASSIQPATACVDIPANPDYLSSGSLEDAIAAIDNARSIEHLPWLKLPTDFYSLDVAHQQFVLINLERTDRKLKPLTWDSNLAQIAINYSKQLRDLNFFSHTSPISGSFDTRVSSNPTIAGHYSYVAENIAGNPVASAGAVYEYMYNDQAEACGHRDNILNKNLTYVGIGEVNGGIYGSMSAQEFLASAPWSPYKRIMPSVAAPSMTISVGKISQKILPLSSHTQSANKIVRVTWFVDSLKSQPLIGNNVNVNVSHLSHGIHTIFAFAVDSTQNYSTTQIKVSI